MISRRSIVIPPFSPSYTPVAVFVGGTSGIGQSMAESLARHTNGNARIIIVGRNRAAAEAIIASFPKSTSTSNSPQHQHEFIQCDATLMKNVHATTQEILSRYPKINFLVVSPGYLSMKGSDKTEEGIERRLALNYYARWVFTKDLLPALRRAKDSGEDAKVYSVLGAGYGGEIDLDNLGLKKGFSIAKSAVVGPTYNDLMMEQFAIDNPDMTFSHASPGIVRTSLFSKMHWSLKPLSPLLLALTYPFSVSQEVCGDYMLSALLDDKKGAVRRGSHGEDIGKTRYFGSPEARKALWDHTVETVKVGGQ